MGTTTTSDDDLRSGAITSADLLAAVTRTAGLFVDDDAPGVLFDALLADLLALTGSEYGYLGEVLHDDDGAPYLLTWAVTNIAWDEASQALHDESLAANGGLEFRNLDTLFGWGLKEGGRVVLANDAATDPRRAGHPAGHPPVRCYLGLPLHHGGRLIGQVGLANRPGGYDTDLVAQIEPLVATITTLIDAYRTHRDGRAAVALAQQRTAELAALVGGLRDAVLLVDQDRRAVFVNQVFCDLWGYPDATAIIGHETEMTRWLSADPETRVALGTPLPLRLVEDPQAFGDGIALAYLNGVTELGTRVRLRDGRVLERDYLPIEHATGFQGQLWIYRDVTEQAQLEARRQDLLDQERAHRRLIEDQNRTLLELDRLKTEFVATVSHELRTPLTSIVNYAELLGDELGGAGPEAKEFTEIIERNAQRLLGLVDDLVLVARLESGGLEIERRAVPAHQFLRSTLDSHVPALDAKEVDVDLVVEADPAPLVVDVNRFAQVVDNLVDNAVKYTPTGGRVTLRARREPGAWTVEVADTGIGIPDAEVDRLFDRFFRASNARRLEISGSGLGLAIVAAIVDLHGGTLAVDTSPEGTTVQVRVPDPEAGPDGTVGG